MKRLKLIAATTIALTSLLSTNVKAEGQSNLARSSAAKYYYVDDAGNKVDPANKDPKMEHLNDGKRGGGSFATSKWGANTNKKYRARFDFGQEITPQRVVAVWLFCDKPMHWISRIKVMVGNDHASMKEVALHTITERPTKRGIPLEINLKEAKGRFVDIIVEQDANPEHKMFSLTEVEIFGPASERAMLDGK